MLPTKSDLTRLEEPGRQQQPNHRDRALREAMRDQRDPGCGQAVARPFSCSTIPVMPAL